VHRTRRFLSYWRTIFFLLVGSLVLVTYGWSQGSTVGGLRGSVTDTTGAVLPGATLKLTAADTGATRTQNANGTGQYSFSDMLPGNYSLTVSAQGFQEKRFTSVTIILNEARELNVPLSAGSTDQFVEVNGDAASVVTLQTSVGTLINEKNITELPLNGRDFQNLVFLAPGASRSAGGTGQGSGVSAGGARPTDNNYLIDGGDANDPRTPSGSGPAGSEGNAVSPIPLDAIAEFSVITSNASAEFGRSSGAVVNVVTKSGANDFHASAWEFLRNSALDTRNFFDPVGFKTPFKQNQFGFWAGGKIVTDHTFYSVSYEGFRQRTAIPTVIPVPTSQFTAALTNPLAHALFSTLYPSVAGAAFDPNNPTTWTTTINESIANNLDGDTGFVRLDQKITEKNQIFATFSIVDSPSDTVPTSPTNAGNLPSFATTSTARATHIVVQDNHIFSANLLNTVRFTVQRSPSANPAATPADAQLNSGTLRTAGPDAGQAFSSNVGDPNGIPTIAFNSNRFTTVGVANNMPQSRDPVVFTYQDTVSWQRSKHEFKFGAQISRVLDNTTFSSTIRPSITLLDTSFANINALALNSQTQNFYIQPSLRQYRLWEQGYFAQDSFHATNRLTVDFGLRYELYNPFTEKNNLLSNAYVLDANNKPEACTALPFNSNLSNVAVINPASYGIGNYCTTYSYVSPRFGFALDVFGNGKTVLRGGYGWFYDRIFGNVYGNARFNPPYTLTTTISNGDYTGAVAPSVVNTTQSYNLTNINPSLRNPDTHHFNLAISQQLDRSTSLTVSYVGAVAHHLLVTQRPNFGTSFADAFRPSNQGSSVRSQDDINSGIIRGPFGNMQYRQSDGSSNYNALLVEVRRNVGAGFSLQASYGYMHSLDIQSDELSGSTDGSFPASTLENLVAPYMAAGGNCPAAVGSPSSAARLTAAVQCAEGNSSLSQAQAQAIFLAKYVRYASLKTNYGDSSFDVRQRFAASVIYKLPFGHNELFLNNLGAVGNHIVDGWGVASIFDTQTGIPFIPTTGADSNHDGDTGDRVVVVGSVQHRAGKLTKNFSGATPVVNFFSACGTDCSFNAGDGVVDPLARIHRGYLRNPGIFNWDFQLNKTTELTERVHLRFTSDFFNLLNHSNFNNLTSSITSPQFGQALSTQALGQTQSRQIQFGAKLQF
jgi:Carboxypeptidase regulatory-like domain/TonB-dependent Receptor Plug Domain